MCRVHCQPLRRPPSRRDGLLALQTGERVGRVEAWQPAEMTMLNGNLSGLPTTVCYSGYSDYIYSGLPDPSLEGADREWAEALIAPGD